MPSLKRTYGNCFTSFLWKLKVAEQENMEATTHRQIKIKFVEKNNIRAIILRLAGNI